MSNPVIFHPAKSYIIAREYVAEKKYFEALAFFNEAYTHDSDQAARKYLEKNIDFCKKKINML